MPKVSVIIPAYNAEAYIEQCLESISNQTCEDIEIILVDDGSTDKTLELAYKHAENDKRMKVITQKNQYAGTARNVGMDAATGEYLSFLDADDFFEPDMLELMYERALETSADTVICRSKHYDDKTHEISDISYALRFVEMDQVYSGVDLDETLFRFCVGWPWDKLFRRQFILDFELRYQEQRTTNDAYFVFMALALSHRISFVDKALAFHRTNNHNSLAFTRSRSWKNAHRAVVAIEEGLRREGLFPCFEQAFLNWFLHFMLWNYRTLPEDIQDSLVDLIYTELIPRLPLGDPDFFFSEDEYHEVAFMSIPHNQMIKRIHELEALEQELRQEIVRTREEFEASTSFRVGRAVTKVPRKIMGR